MKFLEGNNPMRIRKVCNTLAPLKMILKDPVTKRGDQGEFRMLDSSREEFIHALTALEGLADVEDRFYGETIDPEQWKK